jgi:integrase/recombinase XerD
METGFGDNKTIANTVGLTTDIGSLLKAFDEFLSVTYISERTIRTYRQYARVFKDFLAKNGIEDIRYLTSKMVFDYQVSLASKNEYNSKTLCIKTQCLRMTVVIVFLRFLHKHGYTVADLGSHIQLPRIPRSLPKTILSRREMLKILEQPKDNDIFEIRDKAILELLYSCGIRNTEMRTMTIYSTDISSGYVRVMGKGHKERVIPVGAVACKYIKLYLEKARPQLCKGDTDTLFLSKSGRMLTEDFPADIARKYCKRAGVKKDINAHCLRHTFATHMLRYGANIRVIQTMLGHESLETTQIYTHVEISDLKKVHSRTHPREKFSI